MIAARWLRGVALASVALALVLARVLYSSHAEWASAEAALGRGETRAAIDHLGRAGRQYAPGSPFSSRAVDQLAAIARSAERTGDSSTALSAWRELRSSLLATRSWFTPRRALLDEADRRLAELTAQADTRHGEATTTALIVENARLLALDDAPSLAATVAALAGLGAWIACAIGFILRGLDDEQRLRRRVALAWAAGVLAGIALFMTALCRL